MASIWWIRRDLRLHDNLTFQAALQDTSILPVFVLDPYLLKNGSVRRNGFLFNALRALDADLRQRGSYLAIRAGHPVDVLTQLVAESGAQQIYSEEDFTPYAIARDRNISNSLPLTLIQGQLVHHPSDMLKTNGNPYVVFTPFNKSWMNLLPSINLTPIRAPARIPTIPDIPTQPIPKAPPEALFLASETEAQQRLLSFVSGPNIYAYSEHRDRVDLGGTSMLSPYIHFGLLNMRTAVLSALQAIINAQKADSQKSGQMWLNELVWREFCIYILYHFRDVRNHSFRSKYDQIAWRNSDDEFDAWKTGQTGYPIVDAGMRQLLATGWMHNRTRMIVASFLVKDLLVDWRWGEAWFMQNLLDGDLAANNGGWQWTAGVGTDAAPYFRIFNPVLQSRKYDPHGEYIRRWVPELAHLDHKSIHAPWEKGIKVKGYPNPIVDHTFARERVLAVYRDVKRSNG